jgi:hypothetical protein
MLNILKIEELKEIIGGMKFRLPWGDIIKIKVYIE